MYVYISCLISRAIVQYYTAKEIPIIPKSYVEIIKYYANTMQLEELKTTFADMRAVTKPTPSVYLVHCIVTTIIDSNKLQCMHCSVLEWR